MKTLNNKGQMFSADIMFAGIVFLIILVFSITYSMHITNSLELKEEDAERNLSAMNAVNSLLYTQGQPSYWNSLIDLQDVNSIGIVTERNLIDVNKLQKFIDLNQDNYERIKELLGVSKYRIYLEITKIQNNQSIAEFGEEPGTNSRISIITRIAYYNNEKVFVKTKVFEE